MRIQRAVSYCEYSEQIESGEFLRVFNGFTALNYPGDRMCGIENPRGSENNEVLAREIECLAVRGGR